MATNAADGDQPSNAHHPRLPIGRTVPAPAGYRLRWMVLTVFTPSAAAPRMSTTPMS